MVVINPITGRKRRLPRRLTARKKRKITSSTVSQRMYAENAMDSYFVYMLCYKKMLFYLILLLAIGFDFQSEGGRFLGNFMLLASACYASKAARMLRLDSELLDLSNDNLTNSGYNKDLVDITLDYYCNDDECENNTCFSKQEIVTILNFLEFGDGMGYVRVYYNGLVYYKFRAVTLFIYMLRKMSTGWTHKDLADNEFGGSSGRWGKGYSC
jgi:hypothetical protein